MDMTCPRDAEGNVMGVKEHGGNNDDNMKRQPATNLLRVTTYNILAPVWVHEQYYKGQAKQLFDPKTRRDLIRNQLLKLNSDIICLEECQKSELDDIILSSTNNDNDTSDDEKLNIKYHVEFCKYPDTFWTNWLTEETNYEPRENGVALLIRNEILQTTKIDKVEHVPIDLPKWNDTLPSYALGVHACLVYAQLKLDTTSNNDLQQNTTCAPTIIKATIVVSHLDADSSYRAQLQGTELAKKIITRSKEYNYSDLIIWGGDFNMLSTSRGMKAILKEGNFHAVSNSLRIPSVYTTQMTSRVDHILVNKNSIASTAPNKNNNDDDPRDGIKIINTKTYIPECPIGHTFPIFVFMSEFQLIGCLIKGEYGRIKQILSITLCLPGLPILVIMALPTIYGLTLDKTNMLHRQQWALQTYGSDHLPVTVDMELPSTTTTSTTAQHQQQSKTLQREKSE